MLRRHYPASTLIRPRPTPAMAAAFRDVEAATLALDGSPPITRTTFPTCRAHYPGGSSGCACRLLPRSYSLPQMAGGSASALSLSRPAQASLTLRPAGLLNRLKRPLSRGSSPAGYPAEPLVSYQINRQLSGWNLPPLVIRAFGAHCQKPTWRPSLCDYHHSVLSSRTMPPSPIEKVWGPRTLCVRDYPKRSDYAGRKNAERTSDEARVSIWDHSETASRHSLGRTVVCRWRSQATRNRSDHGSTGSRIHDGPQHRNVTKL